MRPRSWLYAPALPGHRLQRAHERGADALILDLEDGVAADSKITARNTARDYLSARPGSGPTWVRINSGDAGIADLRWVVVVGLGGLCLPKVESADEVAAVAAALADAERAAGIEVGSVVLSPLIESAAGLYRMLEIARSPRVAFLQLGEVDLVADLGVIPSAEGLELLMARSAIVTASRAAGIAAPPAPVSPEFTDLEALGEQTRTLRGLGFAGRVCIHPRQVAVVHEVFTSPADEIRWANAAIRAYDVAIAGGQGVATDDAGRLVDRATVRRARRIIDQS